MNWANQFTLGAILKHDSKGMEDKDFRKQTSGWYNEDESAVDCWVSSQLLSILIIMPQLTIGV